MDNKLLNRKVGIVLATVDAIDQYGIHMLSTREVAKRVGISEPTIYKHFKTKNELLLAVLDHFAHYDEDIIYSIRARHLKPVDAIISFIDLYALYYENYPAITALTQIFDVLRCDPDLSEKVKKIFFSRINFLEELIKQAQDEGEINVEANSKDLATTIIGIKRELCLSWRISGFDFPLRERIIATLKMILTAFTAKS